MVLAVILAGTAALMVLGREASKSRAEIDAAVAARMAPLYALQRADGAAAASEDVRMPSWAAPLIYRTWDEVLPLIDKGTRLEYHLNGDAFTDTRRFSTPGTVYPDGSTSGGGSEVVRFTFRRSDIGIGLKGPFRLAKIERVGE